MGGREEDIVNELLEKLCSGLEDEIERQETVLAVCRAQIDAIGARDLNTFEARTAAMDILVREAARAQVARVGIIAVVAAQLELLPEQRTLKGLIEVVPAPFDARLRDIRKRLNRAVEKTRRLVRLNARTIRRSLDFNQRMLACIAMAPGTDPSYDERGITSGTAKPAMIDQRG